MMTRTFPFCCLLFAIGICSKSGAQNVGIGNANPTSRLDVIGNTSSDTLFHVKSANQSSKLVVMNNGNTGIGIRSPQRTLDVYNSMQFSIDTSEARLQMRGFWGYSNRNYNIELFDDTSGGGTLHMFRDYPGQLAIGKVNVPPFDSSRHDFANKLLVSGNAIFHNGNIGVAADTPQAKLEVEDGSLLLDTEARYGGDYAVDNDDYSNALVIGGKGAEKGLKIFKQDPGS